MPEKIQFKKMRQGVSIYDYLYIIISEFFV